MAEHYRKFVAVEAELSEVRAALAAAIGESEDKTQTLEKVATLAMQRGRCAGIAEEAQKALQYAQREAGAEAELRALKDALAEAVGAHPEPLNALQQVALLKERISRADCRDSKYLCALLDILEVRYDEPRPSDDADGGLTRIAQNVLRSWAMRHADAELSNALGSVRRLADELAAVDQALGSTSLLATHGRIAAIENLAALSARSGPAVLEEKELSRIYREIDETNRAAAKIRGLTESDPIQRELIQALSAYKVRLLTVRP